MSLTFKPSEDIRDGVHRCAGAAFALRLPLSVPTCLSESPWDLGGQTEAKIEPKSAQNAAVRL